MLRKVRTRSRRSPVTLETKNTGHILSLTNCVAVLIHSSRLRMKVGIFLAPGLFMILVICAIVSSKMFGGQMSILVTTTMTGTLRARAIPRCSLLMPTRPLFAATISRQ